MGPLRQTVSGESRIEGLAETGAVEHSYCVSADTEHNSAINEWNKHPLLGRETTGRTCHYTPPEKPRGLRSPWDTPYVRPKAPPPLEPAQLLVLVNQSLHQDLRYSHTGSKMHQVEHNSLLMMVLIPARFVQAGKPSLLQQGGNQSWGHLPL